MAAAQHFVLCVKILLRAGGGNIDLGNLDVSEGAILHSQGGNITVHSLDGNCTLESDGGDIEVGASCLHARPVYTFINVFRHG